MKVEVTDLLGCNESTPTSQLDSLISLDLMFNIMARQSDKETHSFSCLPTVALLEQFAGKKLSHTQFVLQSDIPTF